VASAKSGDDSIYNMSRPTTAKKFSFFSQEENFVLKNNHFVILTKRQYLLVLGIFTRRIFLLTLQIKDISLALKIRRRIDIQCDNYIASTIICLSLKGQSMHTRTLLCGIQSSQIMQDYVLYTLKTFRNFPCT